MARPNRSMNKFDPKVEDWATYHARECLPIMAQLVETLRHELLRPEGDFTVSFRVRGDRLEVEGLA